MEEKAQSRGDAAQEIRLLALECDVVASAVTAAARPVEDDPGYSRSVAGSEREHIKCHVKRAN